MERPPVWRPFSVRGILDPDGTRAYIATYDDALRIT